MATTKKAAKAARPWTCAGCGEQKAEADVSSSCGQHGGIRCEPCHVEHVKSHEPISSNRQTSSTKEKEETMARPKKQRELPGLESPSIPEIDALAARVYDLTDQRMTIHKAEREAREQLIEKMREHKVKKYKHEGVEAELEVADPAVKVRVRVVTTDPVEESDPDRAIGEGTMPLAAESGGEIESPLHDGTPDEDEEEPLPLPPEAPNRPLLTGREKMAKARKAAAQPVS